MLTFASPVFAHAAPKALDRLQVIQNKFCRDATDAHWCVSNSIFHRDLELPTIAKFMKDASKRFFDIAGSHPNVLLCSAVDYEQPHRHHFIRRPRNVLTDPPDDLIAAVGDFFSGFQLHATHVHGRAGVRYAFFTSSSPQEGKKREAPAAFKSESNLAP
ncbi:Probable RNA-directed DNA polymerase from transposon X-element [Eumeta japonica]|uniref:Probable RNA-directed DNA polymerase from transposon X-element n=1 Tax=Eumeta variegata TaxID=151549 RepID=A0A4C1XNZ3_EUMVA|nr:Probable RNA-directed DNA polymerase from transposon X-element [Eumeta japonica]